MMDYKKLRLELGLPAPVRVLHITDPHLVAADGRDNPRKWALAAKRAEQMAGATAEAYLQEALDYGEKHCDVTVCTGDLMDFITEAACDKLRALCRRPRLLFAVGNHEFSQYVGERTEDLAYKMETFTQVQSCVPQNLDFASTVVGGVNFITLDNSYYQFSRRQRLLLQQECTRPYPIVLCMHVPLCQPELFRAAVEEHDPEHVAYLCGCPEEAMAGYPPHRLAEQRPDAETQEFLSYLYTQPKVRLILAGHTHWDSETVLPGGIRQLVSAGTFFGTAREITLV